MLIFFDAFDKNSFIWAKEKYFELLNIVNFRTKFILIRNKYELSLNSNNKIKDFVSDEEPLEFADEHNMLFFNISIFEKYGNGIKESLESILFNYLEDKKLVKKSFCKVKKPVLYLYPEEVMDIEIKLNLKNSKLTCAYPRFNVKDKENTWKVRASLNGDIIISNKKYPYLFWEAEYYNKQDINKGFIVKSEEAEEFLKEKLKIFGLNDKESCDLIVYWFPVLIKNKLSLCSFQTERFFDDFEYIITPRPKSIIRVFLSIKKLEKEIKVEKQKLKEYKREGFTIVEWGVSEINK